MRKFLALLGVFIFAMGTLLSLSWIYKEQVIARFLSHQLKVPVTLDSLIVRPKEINASELWIGTPKHSKTPTSFQADIIHVKTSFSELISSPLIIDTISLDKVFVGIEFYSKGQSALSLQASNTLTKGPSLLKHFGSNWSYMLASDQPKKKNKKDYLIRTLILKNLTVQVTPVSGKHTVYPTIPRIELHNISSETGFPIQEIEKAIFHLVLQHLFDKLDIKEILDTLPAPFNLPLKILPFGK